MNVLIVDDVKVLRMGIAIGLKSLSDVNVYEAGNVSSAIRIINNYKIDVLLLDLNLGGDSRLTGEYDMNGLNVAKYIKSNNIEIPCIAVLSGNVNESNMREAYNLGITDFISKPFKIDTIKDLVLSNGGTID